MPNSSLTLQQVLAVLSAAKQRNPIHWLAFVIMFNHGLRSSEVVGLKAANIRDGFLTVQRLKGSLKTTHPLFQHPDPLLDEKNSLLEFIEEMPGNQVVFQWSRQHHWRLFQRYGELAGIPAHLRHPHIFKHSLCRQLIDSAGIQNTRQFVGHKSMGSTGIYLQVDDNEASAAAARALGVLKT